LRLQVCENELQDRLADGEETERRGSSVCPQFDSLNGRRASEGQIDQRIGGHMSRGHLPMEMIACVLVRWTGQIVKVFQFALKSN
jgi:phage gp37-like protein